jgi:hypothetical protein
VERGEGNNSVKKKLALIGLLHLNWFLNASMTQQLHLNSKMHLIAPKNPGAGCNVQQIRNIVMNG